MAQATKSPTTNLSPWRAAQLRQKARGKGKHAMPHGRYSATKKTLRSGIVARPALTLTADQAATLTELATLAYYSDGFTYTDDMMALSKYLADMSGPIACRECLRHANARERALVRR